MAVKVLVVTGYGINADRELAEAFRMAGGESDRVHVSDIVNDPAMIGDYRIVAFPGGFSFGDHLGSGMVLANLMRERVLDPIRALIADGGCVLGVCNGFQTLIKLGLLPATRGEVEQEASLAHNEREGYIDTWVELSFEKESRCLWTKGMESRMCPIRHGEGRFITRDAATLDAIEKGGHVAIRYAGVNPNGSTNAIAGVCDVTGRVLGLMPHPEAFLYREQHPLRRRAESAGPTGLELFERGVRMAGA